MEDAQMRRCYGSAVVSTFYKVARASVPSPAIQTGPRVPPVSGIWSDTRWPRWPRWPSTLLAFHVALLCPLTLAIAYAYAGPSPGSTTLGPPWSPNNLNIHPGSLCPHWLQRAQRENCRVPVSRTSLFVVVVVVYSAHLPFPLFLASILPPRLPKIFNSPSFPARSPVRHRRPYLARHSLQRNLLDPDCSLLSRQSIPITLSTRRRLSLRRIAKYAKPHSHSIHTRVTRTGSSIIQSLIYKSRSQDSCIEFVKSLGLTSPYILHYPSIRTAFVVIFAESTDRKPKLQHRQSFFTVCLITRNSVVNSVVQLCFNLHLIPLSGRVLITCQF